MRKKGNFFYLSRRVGWFWGRVDFLGRVDFCDMFDMTFYITCIIF